MKILLAFMILCSNFAFSQLDENKDIIDSRLVSTNIIPRKIENFREEIKLSNKTLDTIKIWYNSKNLAKYIAVSNVKNGIDDDYFHNLSTHLNIGFKLTNTLKVNNQEFFYDSKMKRLIIKNYSSDKKHLLTEVLFISDFDIIKSKLPQVINW
jgi:hypothetical protein